MYAWIWRRLPGPTAVRVLEAMLLLLVALALLFVVVFPRVALLVQFDDVTSTGSAGSSE